MKKSLFLISALLLTLSQAQGQGWVKDLGNKVKERTKESIEQRVEQKTEEAVEKGLDKTEDAIKGKKDTQSEKQTGTKVKSVPQQKTKLVATSQYDFIPGDKILYFEDFSQDAIGDFPALWTSNSGGEVKSVNVAGGKWFHLNGEDAVYCYSKPIAFPDNFIVEFDIIPEENYSSYSLTLYEENPEDPKEINDDLYPGLRGLHVVVKNDGWETKGYDTDPNSEWLNGQSDLKPVVKEEVNHVIIWVQKRRVRIYHDGGKALDVPTNIYAGTKFNKMLFTGWGANSQPLVSNIKITTASPDMRSKLLTEGKLISYGIYFDSGKDVVKPESNASLKEIAAVLNENPTIRIKIVGHTDSDGDDKMNLDLSRRRAANVRMYLESQFGISATRIETDGMGESAPVAQNISVENKARNRRVEFIKL